MKKFINKHLNFFDILCALLIFGTPAINAQKKRNKAGAPQQDESQVQDAQEPSQKKMLPTKERNKTKKKKKSSPQTPEPKRTAVKSHPLPVVDRNTILDKEIALFNNAVKSHLLSAPQKTYVINTLLPILMAERGTAQLTPQIIATIMSLPPAKQIDALQALVNNAQPPIDPAIQNAYNAALQQLTSPAALAQMDAATLAQLQQLVAQSTQSPILNSTQQQVVQQQIIPVVGTPTTGGIVPPGYQGGAAIIAPALPATPQNIQSILGHGSIEAQIAALQAMMANTTGPVSPATQNAYNAALQQLTNPAAIAQMDSATLAQLQQLIAQSTQSPILSPAQQQAVQQQIVPVIGMPTFPVLPATPQNIKSILSQGSVADQIAALQAMLANAKQPIDIQTQNAYAQALQQLTSPAAVAQMDPATLAYLQHLIAQSAQSPILSSAQQQFVQDQMLPSIGVNIPQFGGPTNVPALPATPQNIKSIIGQGSVEDQIAALTAMLNGNNGPVDNKTQKAYGDALKNLATPENLAAMDPVTRAQLVTLLDQAKNSGLINNKDQKAIDALIPAIGIKPSVNSIQQAAAAGQQNPADEIALLRAMLANAKGPIDSATQDAYAREIEKLTNQAGGMDDATRQLLAKLLQEANQSAVLSPAQKDFVTTQLIPTVGLPTNGGIVPPGYQGGQTNVPALPATPQNIKSVMGQGSVQDQIAALTAMLNGNNGPVDNKTQKAYGDALKNLATPENLAAMDPVTRAQLVTLLDQAKNSGLINTKDQKAIDALIPSIGIKPNINSIQQAAAAGQQNPADEIALLRAMLANAKGPIDSATQDAYAREIDKLTNQAGGMDEATRQLLAQLLQEANQSSVLSPAQKDFLTTQLIPAVGLPTTGGQFGGQTNVPALPATPQNIKSVMGQGSVQDQIAALTAMLNGNNGPVDNKTQKAYGDALKNLATPENLAQMDAVTRAQLQLLLDQAKNSGLINTKDQKAIDALIPSIGIKPSVNLIEQAAAAGQQSTADEIALLRAMLKNAKGATDPATQNAFAQEIQKLTNQADGMDEATRQLLAQLLQEANQSSVLSPAQKDFVTTQLIPAVGLPTTGYQGGQTNVPALPATPQNIKSVMGQGSVQDQIAALTAMLNGNNGPVDNKTQKAYGDALKNLATPENLAQMDAVTRAQLQLLLDQAKNSGLLNNKDQKAIDALIPSIGIKPNVNSIQQAAAAGQQNPADEIALLRAMLANAKGPIDAATQDAYAREIEKLANQAGGMDEATRQLLAQLLQEANQSAVLSPAQKDFLTTQLIPSVGLPTIGGQFGGQSNVPSLPATPQNIQSIMSNGSVEDQIAALQAMLNGNNGPVDNKTQKAYADALKNLATPENLAQMDAVTRAQLQLLLDQAKNSGLLNNKDQKAIDALIPSIGIKPNVNSIQQAAAAGQQNPADEIALLRAMLANAKGPIDSATQDAYAREIEKLANQAGGMDEATRQLLAQLLQEANQSAVLSPAQKDFLTTQLIPSVGLPTIGGQFGGQPNVPALPATPQNIQSIMSNGSVEDQIAALTAMLNGNNGPVDSKTQQVYADALKNLATPENLAQMDAVTRAQLQLLLDQAKNSGLLNNKDQKAIDALIPSIGIKPNVNSIQQAAAAGQQNPADEIALLRAMLANAKGPIDSATQDAYAREIEKLANQAGGMDEATRQLLAQLLQEANQSAVLSPAQKDFVTTQLIPAVGETLIFETLPVNPQTIDQVMNQAGTPKDKIKRLKNMLNGLQLPLDTNTQDSYAQALQNLMAQSGNMDDDTRAQLQLLLDLAGKSPVLNNDQQQYVIKTMIPQIAPEPSVRIIQQAMEQGTADERLIRLKNLLAGANGKDIDPATQQAYADAIKKLLAEIDSLSPEGQSMLNDLLVDASTNPILSAQERQNVVKTMLPKVKKKKRGQLQDLENLLAQAKGQPITPELQNQTFDQFKDMFENRPHSDADYLTKLKKMMADALNSPLLSNEQKQAIKTIMIETVDQELATEQGKTGKNKGGGKDKAGRDKKSKGDKAGKQADKAVVTAYLNELDKLKQQLNAAQGKPLTVEEQNQVAAQIEQLMNSRPKDLKSINALIELLAQAEKSGALSPEQKAYIEKTLLPQLTEESKTLATEAKQTKAGGKKQSNTEAKGTKAVPQGVKQGPAISLADQLKPKAVPDAYVKEFKTLETMALNAKGKRTLAPAQKANAAKIEAFFKARQPDRFSLQEMIDLFTKIKATSLVSDAFKGNMFQKLRTLQAEVKKASARAPIAKPVVQQAAKEDTKAIMKQALQKITKTAKKVAPAAAQGASQGIQAQQPATQAAPVAQEQVAVQPAEVAHTEAVAQPEHVTDAQIPELEEEATEAQ